MKINYEDFVRHLYHFFHIYSSELICAVSHVKVLVAWLCLTLCRPMDYTHQAPLSMGFSRQEYWNG